MNTNEIQMQSDQDAPIKSGRISIIEMQGQQINQHNDINKDQEQLNNKQKGKIHFIKIEQIDNGKQESQGDNLHQQQNSNSQCSNPNHQDSIMMVILNPNLNQQQRLLCNICIKSLNTQYRTVALEIIQGITEENYNNKKQNREIIVNEEYKKLEKLRNLFIQLKTYINNNLQELINNTEIWMKGLKDYQSQNYDLHKEIDWIIKNEQKKVFEKFVVEEVKDLNLTYISKLKNKLEEFSKFKDYQTIQNLLNNLIHQNIDESNHGKNQITVQQNIKKNEKRNNFSVEKDQRWPNCKQLYQNKRQKN